MTFKESLQDDLDNVFFDSEELAAEHIIDGEKAIVVMQDFVYASARTQGQQGSIINKKESATNKGSFLLYIRENDEFGMQDIDSAFDYIPDETNDSVIYMREPIPIEIGVKPVKKELLSIEE